ncbi:CDP-diacylglycerol--glycerol-3-phosphate 3-phosphatidyltransferase, partial [Geodermatophilus sp. DF01-2]|uniref:CDP-diacylglycerol--glycerol-3-phosphate 3-phosphatidyltransferase n=1 Tax=Geodermatophilus sp. DF01-2 TaxID=2559610 RepID=UPI0010747F3A
MSSPADPAATPPQSARVVNLPNALTLLRLAVVPVFAALLLGAGGMDDERRYWATLFFALAIITDRYDGMIARRTGQVTEFGKLADPIADKALTGTALIGLSVLALLSWWVTLTILVREVGVTLLRFWVLRHGVIAASRGGKAKTVVQALAIGLYILPLEGLLASARWWVMAAALVLTVVTGLDYVYRALTLRRTSVRATRAAAKLRSSGTAVSGFRADLRTAAGVDALWDAVQA